ncbi:hypothetical protein [Hymenobacter cellulosivorans]|uniref:Uncharacterized protein n=1 Tax=Hymenobacter cellulosivorans TaxID=2932249 RepID=A0ABY4FCA7_9BACT|nr:hypothetical protein [Hymenobacter cellulosivorans]UOQ54118.1 hypothetical protein MUN80_04985 [Hymenobacter cellulosivorans]
MSKNLRFRLVAAAALVTGSISAYAQTGSVGIGIAVPNSSAVLEVASGTTTPKGFLPPRLSQADRDKIASPAEGLVVYQTDNTPGIYVRTGTSWVRMVADNMGDHTATQNLNLNGKLLTGSAAATAGLAVDGSGNVSVPGNTGVGVTAGNKLDVATATRTNTHPTARPLYVTGALTTTSGAEFRTSDATQGVGIGSNSLYAAGSSTNQDLILQPKGTGTVGVGGAPTTASAALEVNGTRKGLLPPRLTKADRDLISSPVVGLLIIQTDNTPGLYQYTATGWSTVGAGNYSVESNSVSNAPTAAVTVNPAVTNIVYNNNGASNGVVTLGTGTEGQRLVIVNNDNEYLQVVSSSGTGNILSKYAARYIYTNGAWRRES